jgi:hypothetical protein
MPHGLEGDSGDPVVATTLANDFVFAGFNAEKTTDLTTPQAGATAGPTGVSGGEGHYGLFIVGDANVENCNSTAVCCDTWDDATGSCGTVSVGCSSTVHPNPHYTNGEVTGGSRTVPDNLPGGEKWVGAYSDFVDAGLLATNMCGPALRLTSSDPRQSGSAWYQREQEVGEGFDTTFKFRISNPSLRCDVMDDVNTNCRSRGGDGFAFVVQEDSGQALGGAGADLGYVQHGGRRAKKGACFSAAEGSERAQRRCSRHRVSGKRVWSRRALESIDAAARASAEKARASLRQREAGERKEGA